MWWRARRFSCQNLLFVRHVLISGWGLHVVVVVLALLFYLLVSIHCEDTISNIVLFIKQFRLRLEADAFKMKKPEDDEREAIEASALNELSGCGSDLKGFHDLPLRNSRTMLISASNLWSV